jgi:hypothetical protein
MARFRGFARFLGSFRGVRRCWFGGRRRRLRGRLGRRFGSRLLLHFQADYGTAQAQKRASNSDPDLVFEFHARSPRFR